MKYAIDDNDGAKSGRGENILAHFEQVILIMKSNRFFSLDFLFVESYLGKGVK